MALSNTAGSGGKVIVAVAGASGALGKLIVESLKERAKLNGQDLEIRALVSRRPGSQPDPSQMQVDYTNAAELSQALTGVYSVISALQGMENVIVEYQSNLLRAAIANGAKKFVPSDFSADITKVPEGMQRNFDIRRKFHVAADEIMAASGSDIKLTSIYQGCFTELLASGWVMLDFKKRAVTYFGDADTPVQLTTWKNTAEFTAAVALDMNPSPRSLYCAGTVISPRKLHELAEQVTGAKWTLSKQMSLWMLSWVISILKVIMPGKKDDLMPIWVGMQYAYVLASGITAPSEYQNDLYGGIQWVGPEETIKKAFDETQKPPTAQ